MQRAAATDRDRLLASPTAGVRRAVTFRLSGQAYAIALDSAQEIVPIAEISQPPALPPILAGFLNIGRTAVPVVRLARLFGLPEQPTGLYTPLLLVRSPVGSLALLVDSMSGIISFNEQDLAAVPRGYCLNECAEGVLTVEGMHIVLLAVDRILREQELRRMAELMELENVRLAQLQESPA